MVGSEVVGFEVVGGGVGTGVGGDGGLVAGGASSSQSSSTVTGQGSRRQGWPVEITVVGIAVVSAQVPEKPLTLAVRPALSALR